MNRDRKTSVCMLTVLNPALHTRIFYKEAKTLCEDGYDVSIIAPHDKEENISGIKIYPLPKVKRFSWGRFRLQMKIFSLAKKVHADIYHIHTPELLGVAFLLKLTTGAKIIYDVHENYFLNIICEEHYPAWLKYFLAPIIRMWEWISRLWVNRIIYAERRYNNILHFPEKKTAVVENYFQPVVTNEKMKQEAKEIVKSADGKLRLFFSGIIREESGVFQAIDLLEEILKIRPVHLFIAGYAPNENIYKRLLEIIAQKNLSSNIIVIGRNEYVSYEKIQSLIPLMDFGIALYSPIDNMKQTIPTKFYEYIYFKLPFFYTSLSHWNRMNREMDFGFPVDFKNDLQNQLSYALEKKYYQKNFNTESILWKSHEQGFLSIYPRALGVAGNSTK